MDKPCLPQRNPQLEQTWLVGSQRLMMAIRLSSICAALASHICRNMPHPASLIAPARQRFFTMPFTFKSSRQTTAFSLTNRVDSLSRKSLRTAFSLAFSLATFSRAASRRWLPFCLRESTRCARRILRSSRLYSGLRTASPVLRKANVLMPRSTPMAAFRNGVATVATSTTKLAKYRPATSLMMVTEVGSLGKGLDHLVLMAPTFAMFTLPFWIENPRCVNLADCRLALRLNLGKFTFGPLRLPLRDSKKFLNATPKSWTDCCNATTDTSDNQLRSVVFLACVITSFCNSLLLGHLPSEFLHRASASLNTTRAQPNVWARNVRCWLVG